MDTEQRGQQPTHPEPLGAYNSEDDKQERAQEMKQQMVLAAKTVSLGIIKPLWSALKSFSVVLAISFVLSYILFR